MNDTITQSCFSSQHQSVFILGFTRPMEKPPEPGTFGGRVAIARIAAGLTQAKLASLVGYGHQSAIGNIESGARDGSAKTAAIARACNVDAYWLETGEGEMQLTYTGVTLMVAQRLSKLPLARQESLGPIILAAIGPAVSDEEVEEKFLGAQTESGFQQPLKRRKK